MKIIVRAPNWIGDSILSIPALKNLQRHFPDAEIWMAAAEWVSGLFRSFTFIKGFIPVDDPSKINRFRRTASEIKNLGFDTGILFTNSFSSALLFYLAGIPRRWGYQKDGRSALLTKAVKMKNGVQEGHQADYYTNLLHLLGMETRPEELSLPLSSEEIKAARDKFLDLKAAFSRPLIVLNPGAYYGPAKRWPAERFAALADLLQKNDKGNIVITGSAEEISLSHRISEALGKKPIVLSGKTDLRQLAAVISQADVFVTNDSGPMHMANALKVPVVAIFGPTNPAVTGPFQNPAKVLHKKPVCWPCSYRECPFDHRCMTSISPEEVYEACRLYLK